MGQGALLVLKWLSEQDSGASRAEPQLGQRKLGLSSHQRKTQRSPGLGVMMGQLFLCHRSHGARTLLPLTSEKSRHRWIILTLLSYRPAQYIYSTLNIKTYLFSLLVHMLSPFPSCPVPITHYLMRAETSGNSLFPYEYHILQFGKVLRYKMYPILTRPPGELEEVLLRRGECVLSWQKGEHAIRSVIFPVFKRKYFVRTRHAAY